MKPALLPTIDVVIVSQFIFFAFFRIPVRNQDCEQPLIASKANDVFLNVRTRSGRKPISQIGPFLRHEVCANPG